MKNILFALLATVTLVSCKKDDDNNNNNTTPVVSFKIDGTAKSYGTPVATRQSSGGTEVVTIVGGAAGDGINMQVQKSGSVTAGTYDANDASLIVILGDYYMDGTDPITFTVTGIDASHVEGTFSGTLKAMSSNTKKVVSEGKFYAKF